MVDTKCVFVKGKHKRRDNEFKSQGMHDDDESLLMLPLQTSSLGFREAKKAYENGTDEVRQLLMQECSLIYECNVCRNMFRNLGNFISHKRLYCKSTSATNFHSFPDRSSSMLVQTVGHCEPRLVKSRSTGNSPIPSSKSSNGDLRKVIERLKRVDVSSDCEQYKPVEVKDETHFPSIERKDTDAISELEHVSTTTNAVYQTLKTKNDAESIQTEVDEDHTLLANRKMVLGSDGPLNCTAATTFTSTDKMSGENTCLTAHLLPKMSCEICRISFQTEKLLKMHVQKNHTSSTYVFQCPTCAMTFLQSATLIRHLANEHKKPLRCIRKMREAILKKRIQVGDVQVKRLGREVVKRLQNSNTKDLGCSNMIDEKKTRSIPSCSYCLKNFERRAALATHLANCVVRKTSLKNTELTNKQEIDTKVENQISKQLSDSSDLDDNEDYNTLDRKPEVNVEIKQEPAEDIDSSGLNINKLFENLENQTFGKGLHTVNLENIEMADESKETDEGESRNEESAEDVSSGAQSNEENSKNDVQIRGKTTKKAKSKRFRTVSATKQLACRCKICNKQFNALSNLRRHISMFHYRSKRFGCNFCDYRAFRRYDIVNHLTFVHKMTGERESMAVEYVTVHEIKYTKDDVEGDIVVVSDDTIAIEHKKKKIHEQMVKDPHSPESGIGKTSHEKRKKELLQEEKNLTQLLNKDCSFELKDKSHLKDVRRKLKKKALETHAVDKKRPIRNRIKTVNQDFVYDLLAIKEDPKETSHLDFKRSNAVFIEQNNFSNVELTPPPIKITPYRLRTEPLIPADKIPVRGFAANICRNVIREGLGAPSTLPEMPTERPQIRPRLISSSRSDSNNVPIIETSELEAAGIKSTFFDDSFLEKLAKKSNPSFKMKPLLTMQHSPLNSILQKFDASQHNAKRAENIHFQNPAEKNNNPPPHNSTCLKQTNVKEKDVTPNGKQVIKTSSPPATPKKRITLMERLAENRAKRRDTFIRSALEN